jgi:carbamoyl-phosphate synthase large subunit
MKSVGEAMAIGKTFKEAIQKAARSLEIGRDGLDSLLERAGLPRPREPRCASARQRWGRTQRHAGRRARRALPAATESELRDAILEVIRTPLGDRLVYLCDAMRVGPASRRSTADQDRPWFLTQLARDHRREREIATSARHAPLSSRGLRALAKTMGFTDTRIAKLRGEPTERQVRGRARPRA